MHCGREGYRLARIRDGFAEEASVTVTAAFATVTWVGGDVLVPLVDVLTAVTVIGFVPIGSEGTVKVAWPLMIGAVPRECRAVEEGNRGQILQEEWAP